MIAKTPFKNPILTIGILFMAIFLMNNWGKLFKGYSEKLQPTSCKALMVKLERRIPPNWEANCEGNNLAVEYEVKLPTTFKKDVKNPIRQFIYRDMANSLSIIAKNSPEDNLERTDIVRIRMQTDIMTINAVTEGKMLAKLYHLTDPNLIAKHLKATVQVQEVPKK